MGEPSGETAGAHDVVAGELEGGFGGGGGVGGGDGWVVVGFAADGAGGQV